MMNVKFVRVKVTKSEFFSFFFFFLKFLTSSCLFFLFCAPDKSLPHYLCVYVYRWARDEKKGAVQKKKESILLVGLLRIFVLVIVTDFTCRG